MKSLGLALFVITIATAMVRADQRYAELPGLWKGLYDSLKGAKVTNSHQTACTKPLNSALGYSESIIYAPSTAGWRFRVKISGRGHLYAHGGSAGVTAGGGISSVNIGQDASCVHAMSDKTFPADSSVSLWLESGCGEKTAVTLFVTSGYQAWSSANSRWDLTGDWDDATAEITNVQLLEAIPPGESESLCSGYRDCRDYLVVNRSFGFQLPFGRPGLSSTNTGRGMIFIREANPCPALVTPDCLHLGNPLYYQDVVTVETSSNPRQLRQVMAPEGLADVVTISTNEYELRIYGTSNVLAKVGGLWTVTNSPSAVYNFKNTQPGTNYSLSVIASHGGSSKTNLSCWSDSNQGWCLDRPEGLMSHAVAAVTNGSGNVAFSTNTWKTSSSATQRLVARAFSDKSWGTVLLTNTLNPGTNELRASFEYEGNTNSANLALVTAVTGSDGMWHEYDYDTNHNVIAVRSAFLNQARTSTNSLCAVTTYDYTPISGSGDTGVDAFDPRTEVRSLLGHEVGRRCRVYKADERRLIDCVTPGAAWNASDNLVTITKYFTNGTFALLPKSVLAADGLLTVYDYAAGSTYRTNAVWRGQADTNGTAVIAGQKSVTILNGSGYDVSTTEYDVASGIVISQETYSNFDEFGRPLRVTHLDGSHEDTSYGCCGVDNVTDRVGVTTAYTRDGMSRVTDTTRNGITASVTYDSTGKITATSRTGTNGSVQNVTGTGYDLAGRAVAFTNALGGVTTTAYGSIGGQQTVTEIAPDGGTRIQLFYLDGQLSSISGTAVAPTRYEYGVELDGSIWRRYSKEIRLDVSGADTSEWVKTYQDMLDRPYKTVYPTSTGTVTRQTWYDVSGRRIKEQDPDGVVTLYDYNGLGELWHTASDLNGNDAIDLGGSSGIDRVTQTERDVTTVGGVNVVRNRVWEFSANTATNAVLVSETWVSTDGLKSSSTRYDQTTTSQSGFDATAHTTTVTNTLPDASYSISVTTLGRPTSVTRTTSGGTQLGKTTFGYDSHGRRSQITDARDGTTFLGYDTADDVTSQTSPVPGNGGTSQTTGTHFDASLRADLITQPDGTTLSREYFPMGLLKKAYGSRTYPVEYTYDAQGRITTLKTWQNFGANSGTALTTWIMDPYRGWLASKVYANSSTGAAGTNGTEYTYTAGGHLKSRGWLRTFSGTNRIVTTYKYGFDDTVSNNQHGDLSEVSYNDGSTPTVTFDYDRRGRQTTVTRDGITTTRTLRDSGELLSESHAGGVLSGLNIINTFDSMARRLTRSSRNGTTVLASQTFAYDGGSRLASVSDANNSATYAYRSNSSLLDTVTFKQGTNTRLNTAYQYDFLDRLLGIVSTPSGAGQATMGDGYLYNDANQRVRANLPDGSYWIYRYDSLGQVVSAKRYWSDDSPVAGQQFEYAYDDIGNRSAKRTGGDGSGGSLRSTGYTNNFINQQTGRSNHRYLEVEGLANATNTVTVNGSTATRKGEYFRSELNVGGTGVAWSNVDLGVNNGTVTPDRKLYEPPQSETCTYDLDGNLTADARWTYTWDGENRLSSVQTSTTAYAAGVPGRRFVHTYDWMGRRIRRQGYNGDPSTSTWTLSDETIFLYDGWLCQWESRTNYSGATTPLVTSIVPSSTVRNNFTGWAGFKLQTGDTPVIVSALSRWVYSGNSGSHTVKLVTASTGTDLSGGSVTVNTSGASTNRFLYANLAAPITLAANTAYYLVTQETSGGDKWYDYDTALDIGEGVSSTGVCFATTGAYTVNAMAGQGYGPVGLKGVPATRVRTYAWGNDLSGSVQGAGGVGGLLWINPPGGAAAQFVAYDGNGNVVGLVDGTSGTISARYEYGAFGETIRKTGAQAANPFRFSTKYQDDESDLLYYGYRYYSASTGRWLSRDPIGEKGGMNLYGFVSNNTTSQVDPTGRNGFTMVFKWGSGLGSDTVYYDENDEETKDLNSGFVAELNRRDILQQLKDNCKTGKDKSAIRFGIRKSLGDIDPNKYPVYWFIELFLNSTDAAIGSWSTRSYVVATDVDCCFCKAILHWHVENDMTMTSLGHKRPIVYPDGSHSYGASNLSGWDDPLGKMGRSGFMGGGGFILGGLDIMPMRNRTQIFDWDQKVFFGPCH